MVHVSVQIVETFISTFFHMPLMVFPVAIGFPSILTTVFTHVGLACQHDAVTDVHPCGSLALIYYPWCEERQFWSAPDLSGQHDRTCVTLLSLSFLRAAASLGRRTFLAANAFNASLS